MFNNWVSPHGKKCTGLLTSSSWKNAMALVNQRQDLRLVKYLVRDTDFLLYELDLMATRVGIAAAFFSRDRVSRSRAETF